MFVEFVISAYQIFQAQNLLGLPSKENPLELDENVIRQYFSQAQSKVETLYTDTLWIKIVIEL